MEAKVIKEKFAVLSTPQIADACLRIDIPIRLAPPGVKPVIDSSRVVGRVLPVRHYGSVDIFLEAMGLAETGDVLVIDNQGRLDEGCIGDLTVLEAKAHGIEAVFVWGAHRDSLELQQIGLPVFSYGTCPAGPRRLDQREPEALEYVLLGDSCVSCADIFFGDADGVLFVPIEKVDETLGLAHSIWDTERKQADAVREGATLYQQFQFEAYLQQRRQLPSYTFRQHLRKLGGAIEE